MASTRVLKTRDVLSSTIEKDLYTFLKEHSKKTKIPISKLIDICVQEYKDKQENHS